MDKRKLTVGIAGCGTIGRRAAAELDSGFAPRVAVGAITSRDMERAKRFADTLASRPPAVSLERLVEMVELKERGWWNPGEMVTHRMAFDDVKAAYDMYENVEDDVVKVVMEA